MLSDSTTLTIDGVSKTFVRGSAVGEPKNGASEISVFRCGTEYSLIFREYYIPASQIGVAGLKPASRKVEITLLRRNPSDTAWSRTGSGLHYHLDDGATGDMGILSSALAAFVTPIIRDRVLAGEN